MANAQKNRSSTKAAKTKTVTKKRTTAKRATTKRATKKRTTAKRATQSNDAAMVLQIVEFIRTGSNKMEISQSLKMNHYDSKFQNLFCKAQQAIKDVFLLDQLSFYANHLNELNYLYGLLSGRVQQTDTDKKIEIDLDKARKVLADIRETNGELQTMLLF